MSFQGILADLNAAGQGVSTELKCFGSDVTASLLELSVQRCVKDLHSRLDHRGLFK